QPIQLLKLLESVSPTRNNETKLQGDLLPLHPTALPRRHSPPDCLNRRLVPQPDRHPSIVLQSVSRQTDLDQL
ncbi:hypothetical protein L195_g062246, partial [Trifolium pratense]